MEYNSAIIIRGIPGSGKSTTAKAIQKDLTDKGRNVLWYEADSYFTHDGAYRFDASRLSDAHRQCLESFKNALSRKGSTTVIVSNTFTTLRELDPYVSFCKDNGIPFDVIRCTGEYGSIHGVPPATLDRMKARFQDYPGETLI